MTQAPETLRIAPHAVARDTEGAVDRVARKIAAMEPSTVEGRLIRDECAEIVEAERHADTFVHISEPLSRVMAGVSLRFIKDRLT